MADSSTRADAATWPVPGRAGAPPRRAAWAPALAEFAAVATAIAILIPFFTTAAQQLGAGRDERFPDHPVAVSGLPDAAASARTPALPPTAAEVRQALAQERKNAAMRELLRTAGLQWAAAMAAGYAFLCWSRRTRRPALGVGTALLAWALGGWLARVPWPFAATPDFLPARPVLSWTGLPASFVVVPALCGLILVAASLGRRRDPTASTSATRSPAQTMSSRVGYAGLVLATGIGALLLLDLSFDGPPANRYLALYHQGHLWLAMALLSVLLFLRQPLSAGFAWLLSVAAEIQARLTAAWGRPAAGAALLVLAGAGVLVVALALANRRQLTSELGRIWLIGGAAWFFFLRAGPMTDRLARAGPAGRSFLRYAGPLLLVVGVLVATMVATRDMGPLLIAGYASGAFVAATVAMWWHHRSGQVATSLAAAALLFVVWIATVTAALFQLGPYDGTTASRLESVAAPFASVNDQLALVSWFRDAVPAGGFGIGAVPWCGFAADRCSGVPAQIHSDYTFTAMVGVFGPLTSWALAVGATLWLHRLVRHHGRVTRGEPRLVDRGGRLVADGQALVSWIAVAWVALASCQLVVTVAGNLGVLPLTGVTFPFVSFGMTSLLVNVAFLSLCLSVDLPKRGDRG